MPLAEYWFWSGVLWLVYVYLGYPLFLYLLGLGRKGSQTEPTEALPSVSVLVSAHNEEKDIGWKIRETLQWDYPPDRLQVLIASDASSDRTDEIVRAIADSRVAFVRMERRVGKNTALNQLAILATGELLLFTDANAHVDASSFRALIRPFTKAHVGCVTGWEQNLEQNHPLSSAGRTSLGYESFVNVLESRLGSVLVCDGSLFCIRKALFRPLQADLANDLELPLRIGDQGYQILYASAARSIEKPTSSAQEEFQRRRRICSQGALAFWRLRDCLHGLRLWQFLSRKVLRWLSLLPLTFMVVASIALSHRAGFQTMLAGEVLVGLFAFLGWLLTAAGRRTPRAVSFCFYFVLVNLAALVGVVEACLGRRFSVWNVATLSRGERQTTA